LRAESAAVIFPPPGRLGSGNAVERMEYFLRTFGYPAIFLGTFFEGETFVILAGLMAHQGLLDPWLVIFSAFLGSFCGDQTWFYIGRHGGPWVMRKLERAKPLVDRASEMLRRWDMWFILSFRFIYGIRNVAPFAMGNAGVRPLRFLVLNCIAAVIWAFSFGGAGYLFGEAFEGMMGEVKHYEYFMIGFLATILFVVWFSFWFAGWRKRKAAAAAAAAADRAAKVKA
jgi:membrane protein DedA with SNARE-associated domain